MTKTQIVIVGLGNVGWATMRVMSLPQFDDMEVVGIATRRPDQVRKEVSELPVVGLDRISDLPVRPDVAILCSGTTELLKGGQCAQLLQECHTVCSFDDHEKVLAYYKAVNPVAKKFGRIAGICNGWHPGILSEMGLMMHSILGVKPHHLYGLGKIGGLSMGHSDKARKVDGVADALQFTHAKEAAIAQIRSGGNPDLTSSDKIWREVFVVLKSDANPEEVREEIVTMESYYKPYETKVEFVSQARLDEIRRERGMAHNGMTLAVGETSPGKRASLEFHCEWDDNPEGTACILACYARAVVRMSKEGHSGALIPAQIPLTHISALSLEEILLQYV